MKWTNRYNAGNIYDPWGVIVRVAADLSGNIYVTGPYFNGVNNDYCIIKYDASGSSLWTNFYDGGIANDNAWGLAVDLSGNVYITGLANTGNNNYCTIKYDSAGSVLWTNVYDGGSTDLAHDVAVDSSGNAYVTGITWGPGWNTSTIKYDSSGSALWTNIYDSGDNDLAYGIAVDSFNNVYIVGYSSLNAANYDHYTIKYDTFGSVLWTNVYDAWNTNDLSLSGLGGAAVDSSDNVYVTGPYFNGANYDYCTKKYDSSGSVLWTKYYNSGGNEEAHDIAVDSSDNVLVTGRTWNGANWDGCTIKYDSSGSALWTNI